ncbi:hypothetical protein [Pilimelia anulata]|uniref:hypothetical protein n=1 Tax=Pilimelia anulata TaxID=53371 RepID=UPI001666393A|nr:hypothetical protein [Pilimelia anulata]
MPDPVVGRGRRPLGREQRHVGEVLVCQVRGGAVQRAPGDEPHAEERDPLAPGPPRHLRHNTASISRASVVGATASNSGLLEAIALLPWRR